MKIRRKGTSCYLLEYKSFELQGNLAGFEWDCNIFELPKGYYIADITVDCCMTCSVELYQPSVCRIEHDHSKPLHRCPDGQVKDCTTTVCCPQPIPKPNCSYDIGCERDFRECI